MNLQRLLIDRIETRILVSLTMFLGAMVLVGWIAINETGRMEAFKESYLARSVEHGAELFSNNCAPCHGPQGLGSARAPALNNPQLFGINFTADIDNALDQLQTDRTAVESIQASLNGDTSALSAEDKQKLEDRLAVLVETYGSDPIAGINEQVAAKQTERQTAVAQMQAAVDKGYDPDKPNRLTIVGWGGTLEQFVRTTLISGRPTSTSYWPEPMPTWSQLGSGPMRMDQVDDVTNYVLNWGNNRDWTLEDLMAVQQFAKIPVENTGGAAVESVAPDITGMTMADIPSKRDLIDTTVQSVLDELQNVTGDPNNGQALYTGTLACSACHNGTIAPPMEGTFTRIQDTRLNDPALAGYTVEHYLVESILAPNAYIAPGYTGNQMPQDFGNRLDLQMLADLIAFLESQDGPDPLAS